MHSSGLKSKTRGFIKLYDSPDKAILFAQQFADRPGDVTVSLEIDSKSAYENGVKFLLRSPGEYTVGRLDKVFIRGISELQTQDNKNPEV